MTLKKWLLIALLPVLIFMSGCKDETDNTKLKVVSTTGMIHDIVKNIGQDKVSSLALMGPGIDPHLYKASEGDVTRLASADIIFYNGLHLEAKMAEIIEKMSSRTIVSAVAESIPKDKLRTPPEFEGFHDPHVWFDVSLWASAVQEVTQTLINKDPDNKGFYQANETKYLAQLHDLHNEVLQKALSIPSKQRVLVTAHDAFGYFGQAYHFKVMGLQGISTATEAGTKDVQALTNYIVKNKIPAIFVESSVPIRNIQAVQAAVQSKGWDVKIGGELFADAMGNPGTKEGTYIGMVQHNINTIAKALKKQ